MGLLPSFNIQDGRTITKWVHIHFLENILKESNSTWHPDIELKPRARGYTNII